MTLKLIAALAATLAATPPAAAQERAPQERTTVVAAGAPTRSVNPALSSGNGAGFPGAQIFAGLIELDGRFAPQPYLAESWDSSPDGLSHTFRLRTARFHDGRPVTADDVAFSIDVVRTNHPLGRAMFGPVERVETPDPLSVRIVLRHPHPALLASLTTVLTPILPRHVYETAPIRTHPANVQAIGAGPFRLVEFKAGEAITLERNPDFFLPDRPRADRLVIRMIEDMASAVPALEKGDLNMAPHAGLPYREVERLKRSPNLIVRREGFEGIGAINYLEFNLRRAPFNDPRVRRAIAHAVDKAGIVERLHLGLSRVLDGPLHPDNPFASSDLVRYELDLDKARALLDEADLKAGPDGVRLRMTIDAPLNAADGLGRVADALKIQLKQIGVDVERRSTPDNKTYFSRIADGDFDAAMIQAFNLPDPVLGVHRLYRCDNQVKGVMFTNTSGYCNARVDAVLDEAAREMDTGKRRALYAEFQRLVTEDVPQIFTTTEEMFGVYGRGLTGLPNTPLGANAPFLELSE